MAQEKIDGKDLLGQKLNGRYELQKLLGMGGMAWVYEAYDKFMYSSVAVKVLRKELNSDRELVRSFTHESPLQGQPEHKNIVPTLSTSFDDVLELHFIVMGLVSGKNLKEVIGGKHLNNYQAIYIAGEILTALHFAHTRGVVHGDLKPQNVLISDENSNVKVTDFAIARDMPTPNARRLDALLGNVDYLSPEQAQGSQATPRSDIYSVGVILYEMLTGAVPFSGSSPDVIRDKHKYETPRPPIELNPLITPELNSIILKALNKQPEARYSDTGALREWLYRAAQTDPRPPAPSQPPASKRPRVPGATSSGRLPQAGLALSEHDAQERIISTQRLSHPAFITVPQSPDLNFGKVDYKSHLTRTFQAASASGVEGKVISTVDWLKVSPDHFSRELQEITVTLDPTSIADIGTESRGMIALHLPDQDLYYYLPASATLISGIDLLLFVDVIGDQTTVQQRCRFASELVTRAQAALSGRGELLVGIIEYSDYDHKQHSSPKSDKKEPIRRHTFTTPTDAVAALNSISAVRGVMYDFDSALEEALLEIDKFTWQPHSRHILITVGGRAPHPPVPDPFWQVSTPVRLNNNGSVDKCDWKEIFSRSKSALALQSYTVIWPIYWPPLDPANNARHKVVAGYLKKAQDYADSCWTILGQTGSWRFDQDRLNQQANEVADQISGLVPKQG